MPRGNGGELEEEEAAEEEKEEEAEEASRLLAEMMTWRVLPTGRNQQKSGTKCS